MKKLILLLLIVPFILSAQIKPVFEIKHPVTEKKWNNWDQVNQYYLLQADPASDSTIISKEFTHQNGFDGLMAFYLYIEKYNRSQSLPDTSYIVTGNFQPNGDPDSTTIIVTDTSWADYNILVFIQRNYGNINGWVTEDTLEFEAYNARGTPVITINTDSTLYISTYDPTPSDAEDTWQGDPPLPWRAQVYFPPDDTLRTIKFKLGYREHLPNR